MKLAHLLGRMIVFVFRPIIWLFFPYKVSGREHIPRDSRPVMVCGNHISNWDPVFLMICQPRPVYFMAKAELFKNFLGRWILGGMFGAFPVHRGAGDTKALDTAVALLKQGKMVGIYPEGTRSKDGKIGRGRSGAALIASRTGADILPYATYIRGGKTRPFRRFHIRFGPVIPFSELKLEGEQPDLRYATRLIMEKITELYHD